MTTTGTINMDGLLGRTVMLDGVPTSADGLCYRYMREVLRRFGVEIPAEPAALHAEKDALGIVLSERDALKAGDVLVLRDHAGSTAQHLGVCVNGSQVAHYADAAGGVLMRISVLERSGRIVSRCRPRALAGEVKP